MLQIGDLHYPVNSDIILSGLSFLLGGASMLGIVGFGPSNSLQWFDLLGRAGCRTAPPLLVVYLKWSRLYFSCY